MASSTLSLDSLSSPSPSPSPPPAGKKQSQTTNKMAISPKDAATGPALDSDSELSELTDDDQDRAVSVDRRERPASSLTASSSKAASSASVLAVSSLVDEGVNAPSSSSSALNRSPTTSKRGSHQRNSSTSRRGGARKKRSSIVPAPMWGWAEAKATSSSAPVEEEEEEMVGPPRAMEEEEDGPDEPEEEEDGYDASHQGDDSAGIDEEDEDGGFVNQRRLGPYVTQRLPGIRSFYPSGRARHKRRQGTASARKYDKYDNVGQDILPSFPRDDEGGASASGSEYNSPKKKKPTKVRAPTSKRRKGSAAHESSGSERPLPSIKKVKKAQPQNGGDDDENASYNSAAQPEDPKSSDADTQDDTEDTPRIPIPTTKAMAGSKSLSSIATSSISNPATAALTALAVIAADAVEPVQPISRDAGSITTAIISPSTVARPSSAHDLPVANANPSSSTSVDQTPVASRSRTASPDDDDDDGETPAESLPVQRTRRGGRRLPARQRKTSGDWRRIPKAIRSPNATSSPRKGPPPPLDLKAIIDMSDAPAVVDDTEGFGLEGVVDEADDADKDVDMEGEEEAEEVSQRDEEEQANCDEEPAEADDEPGDPDAEIDGEEDQEQDPDAAEVENEQENENENDLDEGENDEDPSPDGDLEDQEIELPPAHRAEALDVLASIELKFALLRERVYVEKMETLAWEETMIQASVHPEMQYLQQEMIKRRDKRLELASRKRSYEIGNATKRRRADEDGVWSWWKLAVDELQTEIIAETNRKRRKLERERRALERPQPIRRIPLPQHDLPLHPPPSLRKILKSYPFNTRKRTKGRRHHRYHIHQPKNLIYPEISTLSAIDIANDLEFLYQNRRIPSSYDGQFGGPPPLWGQHSSLGNRTVPGSSGMPGMSRPMGVVVNGGPPPPQTQPMMNLPPGPLMSQHPSNYDHYGEIPHHGPQGRMRDHPPMGPMGPYAHASGGAPHPRESYSVFSGAPGRNQPPLFGPPPMSSGGHVYPMEHEMSTMAPNHGHQLMPHHPYFGHGNGGHMNSFPASHPSVGKGVLNGRRSSSPSHSAPNGLGPKPNGNWINLGMNVGSFQVGSSNSGKGGDPRVVNEEEERDRATMRERDRKRNERDRDIERRDIWDKEYGDLERDRHMQQQHGGHPPLHNSGQIESPHHHHRPHHHHILHRHAPPHAPVPIPSPGPSGTGGAPPIVHSPRSARDYEVPRPPSAAHPSQSHPTTEVIMLSSNKPQQQVPRDRDGHWSSRNMESSSQHSPVHDYRDRDKDLRKPHSHRPPSRPHIEPIDDRGDRPMSTPFIASSHPMPPSASSSVPPPSHSNGGGVGMWNAPPEDSYRLPGGYLGGSSTHDVHRSPIQAHRYTSGGAPSIGRGGMPANSSSLHSMASPPAPPNRTRPPQSPSYPHAPNSRRSPPTSPKIRPLSPVSNKALLGPGRTVSPTGQRPPSSHSSNVMETHLKNGNLPSYPSSSRTESPLMLSLHPPSNRQSVIGNGSTNNVSDLERHHMSTLSPRMTPSSSGLAPTSKLHTTPVADRR